MILEVRAEGGGDLLQVKESGYASSAWSQLQPDTH